MTPVRKWYPALSIRHLAFLSELLALLFIELLYISLITPPPQLATAVTDHIDTTPLERILFDPLIRQSGVEHERLAGVLLTVKIGLDQYGRIPGWNPYITTGEPTVNNAFNYLFNPFHSLPILILGGVEGSKLATFIALLITGYSMWAFARALGLGMLARLTTAALYMMSGGIIGKFYTGHFQLALSLAWPPLVFAALWWTLRSRSRFAPVSFGIAFALLFFAGNIYYVLHTLICAALITPFHLVERVPRDAKTSPHDSIFSRITSTSSVIFRADRLRRALIAAAFAFGLAALQFFPIWVTRDYVSHPGVEIKADGSLAGGYDLCQVIANFTTPWTEWQNFEAPEKGLIAAVDYAYIGTAPFLLIVFALAARILFRNSALSTQQAALFFLLALLMMMWGAGQSTILQWLYTHIPLLAEFRFLGRALSTAALWWIVLAGIAIDSLWKTAFAVFAAPAAFAAHNRFRLYRAGVIAAFFWLYALIYSTANTSTRLTMVFRNFRWLNSFDTHRFTSFSQAVNAFWMLVLTVILIDTTLLIVERFLRPGWAQRQGINGRAGLSRVIQVVLIAGASAAILDVMTVNSHLLDFQPVHPRLTEIYADIHQWDTNPFPSVNEPFSDMAFDDYENGIRTWGLSEGWRPFSPPGIIPSLRILTDLPRWAIVSNFYSGSSQQFAQQFVNDYGYVPRKCYALNPLGGADNPCLMNDQHTAAVLYEKPDALPYAFAASESQLLNDPASLNATNILPAQVISQEFDTLTIQAAAPGDNAAYYLIVEETSYPGWRAAVDGVPVEVATVQTHFQDSQSRGFLAVPMSPGVHTYILHFEPPGFTPGIMISGITLLGIAFYLIYPLKRRLL